MERYEESWIDSLSKSYKLTEEVPQISQEELNNIEEQLKAQKKEELKEKAKYLNEENNKEDKNEENDNEKIEGENTDEEKIVEELAEVLEEMLSNEFLVRGALLRCRFGSHQRKLNILKDHGVYVGDKPLAHKLDRVEFENVMSFGVCSSGSKYLKSKSVLLEKEIIDEKGNVKKENVRGVDRVEFENVMSFGVCSSGSKYLKSKSVLLEKEIIDEKGNVKKENVRGAACIPCILGTWLDTKKKVRLVDNGEKDPLDKEKDGNDATKGYEILTMNSFLVCRHGGLIEPIDSGQDLIYEQEEEMEEIEFPEELEKLINEGTGFSENEISYIKGSYATYYNAMKFDKDNSWILFLDELLDAGYENYDAKIIKQVTFEKLGIDKEKIREILKDKEVFKTLAMTKINNSDIELPMALNFEETLEYIKRPKCYFKSQISGYIKSKSKTTPIMFNLKLEHTKSEARREVDNLSEGIANEIKLNKYINIDPIIDEMELDGEDLKFKLKAEIDGTEIQIPTKINLNSKKPEFEGISLNDTNNNIEYALETLIDGVYIVSRKYEEKSLDKDNIECSFKVSIEYGLKLEYNNQQLNFGTEVVFSSEEELKYEEKSLDKDNIECSFKVSIEYGLKLEYNNQQLNFGTEVVFSSEEELVRFFENKIGLPIENPNIVYSDESNFKGLKNSDYAILIGTFIICLLIPSNIDDAIFGGMAIKFVMG